MTIEVKIVPLKDAPDSTSALNPERNLLTSLVRFNKRIVRAKGPFLHDEEGIEYLDFSSQYGALPFGHNPDFLWDVFRQVESEQQPSLVQPLISPGAESLAYRLSRLSPGGDRYVIFTNSGAETVEAAIKVARARTGRKKILSTRTGFHGKTLGAASATGNVIYSAPFLADTTEFDHIPYNDVDALRQRLSQQDIAAFIVEPIQGEAGMVVPSDGYLAQAQAICREHRTLFIVDEVQTGLGRTGRLFACEWDDLNPDVILLAKALGGGMVPLGACLVSKAAWSKEVGLYHSSTFANNHLTCSVGLRVMEKITEHEQEMIRQVEMTGNYLYAKLKYLADRYPDVFRSVRGKGLMLGLEMQPWSGADSYFLGMVNYQGYIVPLVSGYLLNVHRILVLPTINQSNVLRIQPCFLVDESHVDRVIHALEAVARLIRAGNFAALIGFAVEASSVEEELKPTPASEPVIRLADNSQRLGTFAFLIHPTDFDDMVRCMPSGCEHYLPEEKGHLRDWLNRWRDFSHAPSAVYHLPALQSKAGGYVDGWLISSMLTPKEMLRLRPAEKAELIRGYIDAAAEVGADVVGLGAFTSIITRGGEDIGNCSMRLTTGNSLTALVCSEALQRVVHRLSRPFHVQTVAIIGAGGSVGRLAALDIASKCRRLILFGNPANLKATRNVQGVAGEIYQRLLTMPADEITGRISVDLKAMQQAVGLPPAELMAPDDDARVELFDFVQRTFATSIGRHPPISVSVNLKENLGYADAIISATSNGGAFIDPAWIAEDAVVCDAARPADVAPHVREHRPELFVFEGGLVKLPEPIRFGRNNILGFPTGVNLACLSETISLAMEGVQKNYSIGNRISLEEAYQVRKIADRHGFKCLVPEVDIARTLPELKLTF